MMPGYWNAHSDRDWQDQCGMYEEPEPIEDEEEEMPTLLETAEIPTTPDAREWYPFDGGAPGRPSEQLAWEQFRTAHPAVTFARITLVDETWLCIEGWVESPDDQGPLPVEADIPIGFGQ